MDDMESTPDALAPEVPAGTLNRGRFIAAAASTLGSVAVAETLLGRAVANAATGAAKPKRGGTLVVATSEEPFAGAFDLQKAAGTSLLTSRIGYLAFNGLVNVDANRKVVPDLATSWEIPNPLTYVFNLRKGVTFHDGTPFNAAAVKYNIQRILDKKTASGKAADFSAIARIDTPSSHQIRLHLKHPYAPLLGSFRRSYFGIMSPTALKTYGDTNPFKASVGTGPFQFVSYAKGDRVVLKRFDNYYKHGMPYLDGIQIRIIPEQSTALAALQSGGIDYLMQTNQQFKPQIQGNPNLKLMTQKSTIWDFLAFNVTRKPFDDKRVRQAFSMALDREGIVKSIYQGLATPAQGAISPAFKAYYKDNSSIPFQKLNTDRAKSLLASSSYDKASTLRFDTFSERPWGLEGDVIAQAITSLGVKLNEVKPDFNTFAAYFYTTHQYWFGNSSWTGGGVDPDALMYKQFVTGGSYNVGLYSNPKVDRLLNQARKTLNTHTRAELYQEANKIVMEDCPVAFLAYPDLAEGMHKDVMGYVFRDEFAGSFDECWLDR
jgi:peptide/nickel transport system substrate-binding protein